MRPPHFTMATTTSTLRTLIALTLAASSAATYLNDYTYAALPSSAPLYLRPTLSSTPTGAFYPYPTSSAHNCSCHEPHHPHTPQNQQPSNSLVISISVLPSGSYVSASASGYPGVNGNSTANATYHSPGLQSTSIITTESKSPTQSQAPEQVETTTPATTTTLDGAAASQSGTPTQSEKPEDPLFTGAGLALRLSEQSVWRWNIIIGVGLGLMVMVI